jgi:hypothetical protein
MFRRVAKIIGTKDYINYRLTGNICTDYFPDCVLRPGQTYHHKTVHEFSTD